MNHTSTYEHELDSLRQVVKICNQGIDLTSYAQIKETFRRFGADPERMSFLQRVSPEYSSHEFLACVDEIGEQIPTPAEILNDFETTRAQHSAFEHWFRIENDPHRHKTILLAARWLCHLTGIRHGTAHLLVTVAGPDKKLLVQIRSMAKSASPGCYDLPVAGHVDGLQSYAATLRKESREELDLDIDQLAGLRPLGGYVETSDEPEHMFFNSEYHQVYTGSLTLDQIAHLTPLPSEVAAAAVFSTWELDGLRRAYPAMFAPSIQQTLERFKGSY